jgi:hypothetical protein
MQTWLVDLIVFVVVVAVFSIALGWGKGSLTGSIVESDTVPTDGNRLPR